MTRIADVALLAPAFRTRLASMLDELSRDLPTLRVYETARAPSRQEALYRRGRDPKAPDFGRTVTRARAYQSAHQYGLAADLVFRIGDEWSWEEPERGAWDRMRLAAARAGLEPLSFERPHVQMIGFSWVGLARGPMDDEGWMRWLKLRADDEVTAPLRIG